MATVTLVAGFVTPRAQPRLDVLPIAVLADHLNLHVLISGAESGGVFDEALVTAVEAEDGLGDGGVGNGPKFDAETAVD
jgi:hypothetical protein